MMVILRVNAKITLRSEVWPQGTGGIERLFGALSILCDFNSDPQTRELLYSFSLSLKHANETAPCSMIPVSSLEIRYKPQTPPPSTRGLFTQSTHRRRSVLQENSVKP